MTKVCWHYSEISYTPVGEYPRNPPGYCIGVIPACHIKKIVYLTTNKRKVTCKNCKRSQAWDTRRPDKKIKKKNEPHEPHEPSGPWSVVQR